MIFVTIPTQCQVLILFLGFAGYSLHLHGRIAPFCCLQADYSRTLGGRYAQLQVAPQWEQSWHLWHQTALALPLRMEAAAVVAATTCSRIEWTRPLRPSCTRTGFRPLCLFDSCTLWPRWHEKPTLQILGASSGSNTNALDMTSSFILPLWINLPAGHTQAWSSGSTCQLTSGSSFSWSEGCLQ